MSKLNIDELLQELKNDGNDRNASRTKKQVSNDDDDDDWFTPAQSTKKTTTTSSLTGSTVKRQDDDGDGIDQNDAWNRTGGSASSYMPSFGGGTLTNTFSAQDTIQRVVSQHRPVTSSGSRKFDDIFGSSPPKTVDADKNKKSVRFDEFDGARPATAPPPSDTLQNRGVLSMMRTGLEPPNKSLDIFSSTKTATTTETGKTHDWLGLKDATSDEDEQEIRSPPRPTAAATPKTESVVTILAKKPPIMPVQEAPTPTVIETKKSKVDEFLEMDRQELTTKTSSLSAVLSPTNTVDKDSFFDGRTTAHKLPNTSSTFKDISALADPQQYRSPSRPLFDTKTDFGDLTFTDPSKDTLFTTDHQLTTTRANSSSSSNLQTKKLEFEKNELKMTMDHMKKQHETEIAMLDEGYKHRLEYVEKSCERREARLKEENEHLLRQLNDRTQQYENEKATMLIDHQRRLDDLQRDRTTELENLRTLQRQAIDHLRREHEQTIQRLKQLKQEELSTALDVTTHTRAFESVVDHMEQNAKHIDELRLKVEAKHSAVLTDKEIEARAKEQQLKAYEDRLQLQAIDAERERKNLQELISRLEVHLSEQTRLVEEERWKALQAQKRMEAMQDALSGEQRLFMEKLARDRSEVQRGKDQLLDDQKFSLANIYESRSQLAEERAKVEALQKTFNEQKHRDMMQNATIEAETRAQQKLAVEQLARLDKREQELVKREEALAIERRSLIELKQRLDAEQSTLKSEHGALQRKIADIDQTNERLTHEKEQLGQLYLELHTLDGKSTGRLNQLQKSIKDLRQQEHNMNEQYSLMAKERHTLNHLRSSIPFKKQVPITDSGFSTMQLAAHSPLLSMNLQQIPQQSIEESSLLRTLRMNAFQDEMYIEDQRSFINSIRNGPHLAMRSTSLSNLNRHHPESHLLRTTYY